MKEENEEKLFYYVLYPRLQIMFDLRIEIDYDVKEASWFSFVFGFGMKLSSEKFETDPKNMEFNKNVEFQI